MVERTHPHPHGSTCFDCKMKNMKANQARIRAAKKKQKKK